MGGRERGGLVFHRLLHLEPRLKVARDDDTHRASNGATRENESRPIACLKSKIVEISKASDEAEDQIEAEVEADVENFFFGPASAEGRKRDDRPPL